MINTKIFSTVLFLLILLGSFNTFGCSSKLEDTLEDPGENSISQPRSVQVDGPLTLEDVHGEHNPKMIGGWGGMKTHDSWFIRSVWSVNRIKLLKTGLEYYYTIHESLPGSFTELASSGFFPIGTVDPVDFIPVNYDSSVNDNDDFINLAITASPEMWTITGRHPQFPSGEWRSCEWVFIPEEDFWLELIEDRRDLYPSDSALKGAFLADLMYEILYNYELRRDMMPESATDLLDDLWELNDEWITHNPAITPYNPGTFIFGFDDEREYSAAIWIDETGNRYQTTRLWTPWPDGWDELPIDKLKNPEELYGIPGPVLPDDYILPEIIWKCSIV